MGFAPSGTAVVAIGTRPEAIKMAPVISALRATKGLQVRVVATAQHRDMLDQVLSLFEIECDHDLNLMMPSQSLPELFSRILQSMAGILTSERPDILLVHGDTSTTLASALAAHYARVPVAHVEAGLRSGDMSAPWPEESNRRLTAPLAMMHFAPTSGARDNLVAEGIDPSRIHVTGNTVIDALLAMKGKIEADALLKARLDSDFRFLDPHRRILLVTCHRRENFGPAMQGICSALTALASRNDVQIVYPVHPNPHVRGPVHDRLGNVPNVHLTAPLGYLSFVYLMLRSHLILTDSGGVQEEAPSLGKPVLVLRSRTERPEAIRAGTAMLAGTDCHSILRETARILDDEEAYRRISRAHNPYGDGLTGPRIASLVASALTPGTGREHQLSRD